MQILATVDHVASSHVPNAELRRALRTALLTVATSAFGIGSRVVVDGASATVQLETSTQLLIRIDGNSKNERWVPRSHALPDANGALSTAGADAQSALNSAVMYSGPNGKRERDVTESMEAPAPPRRGGMARPEDESEPALWDDECFICGNGGKLTCCDACPRVYHLRCLPAADSAQLRLPGNASKDWWCPPCRKIARLTFCMGRQLAHPSLSAEGAVHEVAQRLFAFMSDDQVLALVFSAAPFSSPLVCALWSLWPRPRGLPQKSFCC